MKARLGRQIPRILGALLCLAVLGPLSAQNIEQDHSGRQRKAQDLTRNLSLAYQYHELANLYIRRGEAEKGMAEARRILQLELPAEAYEELVVESLIIISNSLGEARRYDLAQDLLDETIRESDKPANQAKVYKFKARLYRLSGNDDKAIESWQKAIDLEGRISLPGVPK